MRLNRNTLARFPVAFPGGPKVEIHYIPRPRLLSMKNGASDGYALGLRVCRYDTALGRRTRCVAALHLNLYLGRFSIVDVDEKNGMKNPQVDKQYRAILPSWRGPDDCGRLPHAV